MGSKEILEQALQLRPDERFILAEGLLKSLDEPGKVGMAHLFPNPGLKGGPCPPYKTALIQCFS